MMTKIKLADLDVLERLHRLPDDCALTTDEAAIMLRLSPPTLDRMRRNGSGPAYIQGGGKGSKGTNQRVTYLKSDLLRWQSEHKVTSTMAAAVRRGQAFMPYVNPIPRRTDFDLITKRPFYMDASGHLSGSVEDEDVQAVIDRLGLQPIVWLSPVAAAVAPWSVHAQQVQFAANVRTALLQAVELIDRSMTQTP
jgi:hypothetical protein